MIFRNFLGNALGSYAKIRILRYLLAESLPASENEIARILDISPMTVNRVMKGFQEISLVMPSKIGAATLWKINKGGWSFQALQPLMEIKSDPLKGLISILKFGGYKTVREAYLFGSVAEGREEPTSDIDILLLVKARGDKRLKKFLDDLSEYCVQMFGNRLSAIILTQAEAAKNKKLVENAREGIKII